MRRLLQLFSVFIAISLVISCGGDSNTTGPDNDPDSEPEPTTGTVEVTTSTSGDDQDDGYEVSVDGTTESIGPNETVTISDLEEGSYDVELTDIAGNCELDSDNPRSVSISAGNTTSTTFDISCQAMVKNKIVFVSTRDQGKINLFLMNSDGSNPQQLTAGRGPVISKNGTKIAFERGNNLYQMNADGSDLQQITGSSDDSNPAWSPDGSKIVFDRENNGNSDIFVVNADGTGVSRLTFDSDTDASPDWSPDGSKIVFHSDRDGDNELYTMNTDGSNIESVTSSDSSDTDARFSPDGSKLVFTSDRNTTTNRNRNIYTINVDGTGLRPITNSSDIHFNPAWSADGSELVYSRKEQVYALSDIFKINADGSGNPVNLTNTSDGDGDPHWSPVE